MYSNRHFCQILMKLKFLRQIFEKYLISNLIEIRLLETEFFHADGQT
jgi:hypothetical protein